MKSWAHNHQDNIHALWNSVSFWLVMFYINKITLHIFPMTFHTAVCLRRVSLTVNIAVTINSCIWNYYKSSTMYSVNFSTNGHLNHFWFLTMKILLCQTSLYKHLCVCQYCWRTFWRWDFWVNGYEHLRKLLSYCPEKKDWPLHTNIRKGPFSTSFLFNIVTLSFWQLAKMLLNNYFF